MVSNGVKSNGVKTRHMTYLGFPVQDLERTRPSRQRKPGKILRMQVGQAAKELARRDLNTATQHGLIS
jgi:hypothetical protein